MSIMIELSPQSEEQLRAMAALDRASVEAYASRLLAEALEWDARDYEEAVEGIRRGLEACDEGRARPASDVIAKYEAALTSEAALARDWARPEEDAAWSHLQQGWSS